MRPGRVLRPGGILIAPNFVNHNEGFISRVWSGILRFAGVSFEHQWTAEEYIAFLLKNGWNVTYRKKMAVRLAIVYTECTAE